MLRPRCLTLGPKPRGQGSRLAGTERAVIEGIREPRPAGTDDRTSSPACGGSEGLVPPLSLGPGSLASPLGGRTALFWLFQPRVPGRESRQGSRPRV